MHKKISIMAFIIGIISITYFIYQKVNYKIEVKLIVNGKLDTVLEAKRGLLEEMPEAPDVDGYTFNHWEYNGKEYDLETKLDDEAELVGVYDKIIIYYQVTFKYENGKENKVVTVEENTKVEKPSNPSKSGYIFKGWYLNDKAYNFNNPVTSDLVIVAKYNKKVVASTPIYSASTNQKKVCNALKANGFSNAATAAIMANVYYETRFTPTLYGCGGKCYGIIQWYQGRFTKLKNYCGSSYTTAECQVKYLVHELKSSYGKAYNTLKSNQDVVTMTTNFCKQYVIPANTNTTCKNRANGMANTMYKYASNGCQ